MTESPCDVCRGTGKNLFKESCPFCNGTGEWNDAAAAFMINHICQCILLDRKFCPVCELKCHHDTTLSPKCTIDDSPGGLGAAKSVETIEPEIPQEEEIVA